MLDSLDASNSRFAAELNAVNRRLERAQNQVASGKRINTVSDDPDRVSTLLSARAALASAEQSASNLGRVQTEVNTAEKALGSASKVLERARTLAAQGANGTQTADSRGILATEVESLMEQLVGISRTSVEGRFIFSGDRDQTAPYTIDLTQPNPISAYAGGATSTRLIEHPNGSRFPVARPANLIFDSADPSESVFQGLTALRNGLRSNDEAAIAAAQNTLASAAPYLERSIAYYGATQNKLAAAIDYGKKLEFDLKVEISEIESADVTAAILEMQQANIQQQAALQSRSQIGRRSLFDFLR